MEVKPVKKETLTEQIMNQLAEQITSGEYKNVQIAWREDEYFPIIGVLWKACTGQIDS